MLKPRPTITYFVSHCHAKNKKDAIATLSEVIRRLGYNISIQDTLLVTPDWEAQILLFGSYLTATINIYDRKAKPIASEDELPFLDVTVRN